MTIFPNNKKRFALLCVLLMCTLASAQSVTEVVVELPQTITAGKAFSLLSRDCRVDGTIDTTGVVDASAIINTCIANAVTNKQPNILLPSGSLLINTALNMTNRWGLHLRGSSGIGTLSTLGNPGGTATILLCNTGTVCIDTTGSSNFELSNMQLVLGGTGVSTPTPIGILQGRDNAGGGGAANPFCFAENADIHDVGIYDYTNNTAANGGRGYIPIYNFGAENGYYRNSTFYGGTPMVFTKTNIASISSPYQTIGTGCPQSMTVEHLNTVTTGPVTGSTTPNIEAEGTATFNIVNHEFFGGQEAILFEGASANRWFVQGNYEVGNATLKYLIQTSVNVRDSRFSVEMAPTGLAFVNPTANSLSFTNDDFDSNTDGAPTFITNTATGTTFVNGRIVLSAAVSASNTVLNGTYVSAPTVNSTNVSFSTASNYILTTVLNEFLFVNTITKITSGGSLGFSNILLSGTAPTISTHFNTSGDSIVTNGTGSFTITVGNGAGTSTGVLSLPTIATGWTCWLTNQSRADHIQQTGSTTASATFTNFGTTFAATNWTNGDTLRGGCTAN